MIEVGTLFGTHFHFWWDTRTHFWDTFLSSVTGNPGYRGPQWLLRDVLLQLESEFTRFYRGRPSTTTKHFFYKQRQAEPSESLSFFLSNTFSSDVLHTSRNVLSRQEGRSSLRFLYSRRIGMQRIKLAAKPGGFSVLQVLLPDTPLTCKTSNSKSTLTPDSVSWYHSLSA